ncbi:MAG: RNA methyltransferase [Clostridiales bacterium]|jgi:TrmH family RNA methyltransferase|nr:RNA methyltransferase [Clostridiales bacterium]
MAFQRITSADNPAYKYIKSLTTKKGRDKADAFIIEGERFAAEALTARAARLLAFSESYASRGGGAADASGVKTIILPDHLFERVSGTETPQGVLAVCEKRRRTLDAVLINKKRNVLIILAEDISDPGNLGTIIRTADAAGADAVILTESCAELYNPKVLRAAAGAAFRMPVIEDCALADAAARLKAAGIKLYAAHVRGGIVPYGLNLTESCAFIVGSEARGISDEAAGLSDALVKLPMADGAESLNAAMAAGILMYEAVRQRRVLD